ncbi:hypothetical protein ACWD8L_40555 [Streptomyces sp. NPDC005133]
MECLARLLEEREGDGTTVFNRLKRPAQGPSWSHFKNLTKRLEWLDSLGDTDVWMDGMAAGKVTDFAGKADAADVAELRDYRPVKRLALVACLVHKGVRARPPAGFGLMPRIRNGKTPRSTDPARPASTSTSTLCSASRARTSSTGT